MAQFEVQAEKAASESKAAKDAKAKETKEEKERRESKVHAFGHHLVDCCKKHNCMN